MSKVGKRAFLLLLAIPIVINVMAQQTKKPTLEDLSLIHISEPTRP